MSYVFPTSICTGVLVWESVQLNSTLVVGEDFIECWTWLINDYDNVGESEKVIRRVVFGLWRLWKCRNSLVLDEKNGGTH